jgi:NTP pyrophosphatase (non-canonical NTP hydrolase)
MSLDFRSYQIQAAKTAIYPNRGNNLAYPTLGLCGEAGEVAEKVKKIIRDNGGLVPADVYNKLVAELGDVLWYVSTLCDELQCRLEDVADLNLQKLRDRQERNQLKGSGDNR